MSNSYQTIGSPNDAAATAGGEGTVNAKLRTLTSQGNASKNDSLRAGSGQVTVLNQAFAITSAANTVVVSGVTNYKIRVIGLTINCSGSATDIISVGIQSSANTLVSPLRLTCNVLHTLYTPVGWVAQTNAGEHLGLSLSAVSPTRGIINYVLVEQ